LLFEESIKAVTMQCLSFWGGSAGGQPLQKIPPHLPCQSDIQTPLLAAKTHFYPSILYFASSLLLYHFFFLSTSIGTTPQTIRPLYNKLDRRTHGTSLLLTILSIFVLPWLTFAFCIIAPFFLNNRMG
jgi:hypothetical protein